MKPVYGARGNGSAEQIGSAPLLALPEGYFLLTAVDVVDWNEETTLYIGHGGMIALDLDAFVTVAPNNDRNADHVDLCNKVAS